MTAPIAPCVCGIGFSAIRRMMLMAKDYEDVVTLGIGEPDMHTPEHVVRAALADALAGWTHYAHSQGDPELRQAISERLAAAGRHVAPERIQITAGGMGALTAALRTLLCQGDEVIVPEPHFPDYAAHAGFAGGRLVAVPAHFEDEFVVRPEAIEAAITDRTRVILLNSPCNPTGAVIPADVLEAIADIACRHDLFVISDEVYDSLSFDGPAPGILEQPGMAERTLVVNSFSKTFAMTGWRVGYAYGPEWFMREMIKVVSYTTASTSTPGQRAALAALRGPMEPFAAMVEAFARRSAYVYSRVAAMPGLRVNRPRGTFYLFVDVLGIGMDGLAFAEELLRAEQVVVIPGRTFGPSCAGFVRLACTVPMDRLEIAMDRLERFVSRQTGTRR
jgi:aspartate/methionine/tyrosine aminotransferase